MKFATGIFLALATLSYAGNLDFAEAKKEITAPADATTVTADFEFTNKTDKPVTIAKSDPGCSCLHVQVKDGKMKYAPGESGLIRATFDMQNFSGSVDKVIGLWLDDNSSDKPNQSISVRVHIPVLVVIEPKTVNWEIGAKPETKIIQVHMEGTKPIHVMKVSSSSDLFTTELKTLEDGAKYEIAVTPKNTTAAGLGVFRIETDCEVSKHKVQQAFGVVRKVIAKP